MKKKYNTKELLLSIISLVASFSFFASDLFFTPSLPGRYTHLLIYLAVIFSVMYLLMVIWKKKGGFIFGLLAFTCLVLILVYSMILYEGPLLI